jgi:outer membrane autotransporter protein
MKILSVSRKAILRAIHAACVALFLMAAAQRAAMAQSFSNPPFSLSGSTINAASGTYSGAGYGFFDNTAAYTLTLGSGTSVTNTDIGGYYPSGTGSSYIPDATVTLGAGTVLNHGTLALNPTSVASFHYYTPLALGNSGDASVTNYGTLSSYVPGAVTGLGLSYYNAAAGSLTVVNESGATLSGSAATGGLNSTGEGIHFQSNGSLSITNSGTIQGNAVTGYGIYADSVTGATGTETITNLEGGTIQGVGTEGAYGMDLTTDGSQTLAITNDQGGTISASGGGDEAFGIEMSAYNSGGVTVTNNGMMSATSTSSYAYGMVEYGTAALTLTNGGTITATSTSSSAFGFLSDGTGGMSVTNTGTITTSGSTYSEAIALEGGGASTVVNSGIITAANTGSGSAYGVNLYGSPLSVTNSGTITASSVSGPSYGIYLHSVGTVIDSGNITAGTDAISAPSGSTVTLSGRPIIIGTISGGATSASTSHLVFNLSIPAANLAAAQTQLNTEITAYGAQDGGNYTFTVDGLTFDISNFAYGNGDITDDLTLPPPPPVTRLYRNTPGFYSEGLVLDNLNANNAQASKLLNALGNVPDAGVPAALAELSPKELEVFRNVAFDNNTFNDEQINNHLANLRDGLTGFDSSALTVQDSSMDPTLNQVRDHLLAYNPAATPGLISDSADSVLGAFDAKDMKSAQVNTQPVDRWSTFIAGNVILADLSNNLNVPDSNYTTGNVSAGLDYRLDDHFTVGALFAYAHTDADLDARSSSATVDSYSPGIYASYVDGPWYGNFLGAYTRNSYTEDRDIDITGLNGDNHGGTSGNQGSANLTGGYEFQKGAFKFGPVATLQYVHLSIDSIQEQGPTALDLKSQDQDSLRSLLGFEGRFNANVGPVSLTPHVSVSWQHEYLDNSAGITSQFDGAGGGSFSTQTDSPDRDSAFVDVGLDATVSKNVTVFVDYEAQAGQSNFFAQSAQGGVRIGF